MKIAFCSCSHAAKRPYQPAWTDIAEAKPDLLLLMGDNIYAPSPGWSFSGLLQSYRDQFSIENFSHALRNIPFIATWDDHDLGPNNAYGDTREARSSGKGYFRAPSRRQRARQEFLNHLRPSQSIAESVNFQRNKTRIYCTYMVQDVFIIVLDIRYYRKPPNQGHAGRAEDLLGVDQANWLWRNLEDAKHNGAKATIVCSGSPLIAGGEPLADYPIFFSEFVARFRECPTPIHLSGDIHRNKISTDLGFLELVSSGVAQHINEDAEKGDVEEYLDNWGELNFLDLDEGVQFHLHGNEFSRRSREFVGVIDYT